MNPELSEVLSRLPPLDRSRRLAKACKICGGPTIPLDVVDFNKVCLTDPYAFGFAGVPIYYYRCERCHFLGTFFFDAWSPEDFRKFIYNDDYAAADPEYLSVRPRRMAATIGDLFRGCEAARILDYGSGSGAFAEALSARGYGRVECYDPFSTPLMPDGRFDIVTAFEVIEHSTAPLETFAEIARLLAEDGCLVISQSLQPDDILQLRGSWWYLAPRSGHVSTFADDTLCEVAGRIGRRFYRGGGLYGFGPEHPAEPQKSMLERVGRLFSTLRLDGSDAADPGSWHGPEQFGATHFRWTRSSSIRWPARTFAAGTTKIRIPFLMSVEAWFAEQSRLRVGAEEAPVEVANGELTAAIELPAPGLHDIELLTPDPRTPREVNGAPDDRSLGLAIPFGEISPLDKCFR